MRSARSSSANKACEFGLEGLVSKNRPYRSGRSAPDDREQQCKQADTEGDHDLRKPPLSMRKANLVRLLARRPEGIFINPFERGEIGPANSLEAVAASGDIGPRSAARRNVG